MKLKLYWFWRAWSTFYTKEEDFDGTHYYLSIGPLMIYWIRHVGL